MKESLTPEKIQEEYLTGDLGKEIAAELLISLLESSENTKIRVESIKVLEKINFKSEKIFKTIENHLISDDSAIVRTSVAEYLIKNFLEDSLPALRWVIQHERSPLVLQLIIDSIEKFDTPQVELIKEDVIYWYENFSSKIGVVPLESKFFLDLEALFAEGKRNYEIDPFSYKYFENLSDIKDSEPWLVIKNKHVEILNFNYFNWKFIKDNMDIVNSLSKLHDIDVYLCSLRKYSHNDVLISSIPESIGSLIYLKKLILRRNGLIKLPSSIKKLTLLKELDLSYNKFEEVPHILMLLKSLEKLNLKRNKIQRIPDKFRVFLNSLDTFYS